MQDERPRLVSLCALLDLHVGVKHPDWVKVILSNHWSSKTLEDVCLTQLWRL
jgi:hypothetical protein